MDEENGVLLDCHVLDDVVSVMAYDARKTPLLIFRNRVPEKFFYDNPLGFIMGRFTYFAKQCAMVPRAFSADAVQYRSADDNDLLRLFPKVFVSNVDNNVYLFNAPSKINAYGKNTWSGPSPVTGTECFIGEFTHWLSVEKYEQYMGMFLPDEVFSDIVAEHVYKSVTSNLTSNITPELIADESIKKGAGQCLDGIEHQVQSKLEHMGFTLKEVPKKGTIGIEKELAYWME